MIVLGFAGAILLGTALLMIPTSKVGPGSATFLKALFTATSAVCVTGLIVVDTPVYWTGSGHVIILALIQVGGFGIMSLAFLLGVLLARRIGLRSRISSAAEMKSVGFGDVRGVLLGVLRITLIVEAVTAALLTTRFMLGYGHGLREAVWLGVFHSISSFNNAGFALFSDNLIGFAGDPWICLPICAPVIIGGLGFPVLFELRRHFRYPRKWHMKTKLVLSGTGHVRPRRGPGHRTASRTDHRHPQRLRPAADRRRRYQHPRAGPDDPRHRRFRRPDRDRTAPGR